MISAPRRRVPVRPANPWLVQHAAPLAAAPAEFWRRRPRRRRWLLALLALVLLIGIWLATGFYQLEAGERGLVQRFGRNVAHCRAGTWLAHAVADRNT